MSHIVVTSATGTVGRQLIATLKTTDAKFSAMSSGTASELDGMPLVRGDFTQPESLKKAFAGIDTLFLLLPLAPDMLLMGRNAIAAAKAAGVRHVVRSSGAGADPDSPFALARVHGEIDRTLQDSGLAWTILRPNSFMQNHLTYNLAQIRAGCYYAPHGQGATSLIDVQDIAECAAGVLRDPMRHANRIYTLTGGEAIDNATQMAIISAATGREISYCDIPDSAAVQAMSNLGMPPTIIAWLSSLNAVIKTGYAAGTTSDVSELTGHLPRSYKDFVRTNAHRWAAQ